MAARKSSLITNLTQVAFKTKESNENHKTEKQIKGGIFWKKVRPNQPKDLMHQNNKIKYQWPPAWIT